MVPGRGGRRAACPQRRLGRVQQMAAPADGMEDPSPLQLVGVAVLQLEICEGFLVGQRRLLCEPSRAAERVERVREMRVVVPRRHVAERPPEHRVVARRNEVKRAAHDGRFDDVPFQHGTFERLSPKACDARPEPDVGRGRPLALKPGEPLDRRESADLLALEEELPRERRAVQLSQRQDALCQGTLLNSTDPPVTIAYSASSLGWGSSSKRS